jgi:hypothetical protein
VAAPPPADGCAETLVSAQLFGPGGTSFEAQTRVYVDSSVDGNILVRNPYGEGERVGGRQNVVPESFGPTQGGAAGFTRTDFFEIWSTSGSKECAGFKSMTVNFEKIPGSDVNPSPNEPEEIFVTGEIKQVVLPNPIPQGRYEFTVTIEDHAGNTRTFGLGTPLSITKDTTPPTVEVDGITTRVADGVATLSFDGLKVQDNFYPTADSQANAEYASTWILVKAAGEAPTEQDWLFNGVVRSGPIGDSLRWNMALGMVGQFKPNTDYQLYVRFLDGAANPSRQLQSGRIRLAELNVQRVYLPMLGHLGR